MYKSVLKSLHATTVTCAIDNYMYKYNVVLEKHPPYIPDDERQLPKAHGDFRYDLRYDFFHAEVCYFPKFSRLVIPTFSDNY